MSHNMEIEKIWLELKDRSFWAEVSVNCKKIDVTIEYFPPFEMKVNGLEPEYPPYVWFKNATIMFSFDKRKWDSMELESGIQVLRLLDPRVLLYPSTPPVFRVTKFSETEEGYSLQGEYDLVYLNKIADLKFPDDIILWMTEGDRKTRWVRLILRRNDLIHKMIQSDLPPSRDEVTLIFKYED